MQVINLLKNYSQSARDSMSRKTKAPILWIILLQSRQFAIGEIASLAEFLAMYTNLAAKHSLIIHVEVASELIEETLKTPQPADDKSKDQGLIKRETKNDRKLAAQQTKTHGIQYSKENWKRQWKVAETCHSLPSYVTAKGQ